MKVHFAKTTASTNDDARAAILAGTAAEGDVFAAGCQTAGRGRAGSSFFSPPGTGIYFSVVLRPRDYADGGRITVLAALAVCSAIENVFGKRCGIKWVNDVLLDGKKCAGILCETFPDGDGQIAAVVGIGINVGRPEGGFPASIKHTAGYVSEDPGPDAGRLLLAETHRLLMRRWIERDRENAVEEYRAKSVLTGRKVTVNTPSCSYEAIVKGIDDDCRLIVSRPDGTAERLDSGEVKITG